MTTVVIGGREFVLGAAYAPADPLTDNGQPRGAKRLAGHDPPERCPAWYAGRGGRVRLTYLSGNAAPPWSGDHWVEWAGERVEG